jgi:two-component sensor histidine kinase
MSRRKQYPKKILARATLDEHGRLMTRAKQAELSLSRFLIECGLTIEVASPEDRSQRERALREIRRIGNNLNQVAHQLNMQSETVNQAEVHHALVTVRQVLEKMGVLWRSR